MAIPFLAARVAAGAARSGGQDFDGNIQFDVKVDDSKTRKFLKQLDRQMPFALARGLTLVAEDIQKAEIDHAHQVFNIRGNWWKAGRKYGFRVDPAKKTRLRAEVYTKAHWLFDHVQGGVRSGSSRRAVPKSPSIRRTQTGSIRLPDRPPRVKGGFTIGLSGGKSLLLRRVRREKAELMYLLIPRARIKKRFYFYETGLATAKKTGRRNFQKALDRAIRTAR